MNIASIFSEPLNLDLQVAFFNKCETVSTKVKLCMNIAAIFSEPLN